ncbi:MAG TPA: TIGR03067 domain-containing protein [Pirellulaceae bacterium]|nr:TIGR03067 domain-containing protein [Pirellulaceae bacterium]
MLRWKTILFAGLLTSGLIGAAAADDKQQWQGTWTMVSCIANGESTEGNVQWVVSGDAYKIRIDGKLGSDRYPFQLDASKKRIDVNHHDTPPGTWGGKLKGIYEIKGDTLKVCYDLKGQRYPTSFAAGPGSGQVIYQFRRAR